MWYLWGPFSVTVKVLQKGYFSLFSERLALFALLDFSCLALILVLIAARISNR